MVADFIGRDPELQDRFIPTVLFSTAVRIELSPLCSADK